MEAESFDKKIRELLDGAEFPYQEADWQQAQTLLQKQRKRKSLWWLWLLPALVAGTAWWLFVPSQAETQPKAAMQVQAATTEEQPEILPSPKVQAAESASVDAREETNAPINLNTASEPTSFAPAYVSSGKKDDTRVKNDNNKAFYMEKPVDEAADRPGMIAYLLARKARLQSIALEKPTPAAKAVEPFQFDRPKAKSAPVWMLGLYAASQPNLYQNGEKGAGNLNWQGGALVSLQWSNGVYAQWLTGLEQQGLQHWTYNNTTTSYDFGFERTTQTLELRDYWTLQNAIQIGYARENHRIFTSLSYQHYLLSRYQLKTQIDRQDAPAVTQTENGYGAWAQAGIQGLVPGLGYQYDLSRAFRLGLQYRFSDRSSSNYQLPGAAPWQFSLQYNLFQRQKQ